jgi:4-hydroxybenzoate polyprenyltransferase
MAKLLAYARLLRLPNLFTAAADPIAGWFVVGGGSPTWHVAALSSAGACLYAAGIVFNDVFDYRLDCRERPERPLPRGDISRATAAVLAAALMVAGLGLAMLVNAVAFFIALFLAGMIFFYNVWSKHFLVLGPLTMGTCRFANFLLGMRCCPPRLWLAPLALGVYVLALSFLTQRENENRTLVKQLLLGIIGVDALAVLLMTGDWQATALVLSLLLPAAALAKIFAMT